VLLGEVLLNIPVAASEPQAPPSRTPTATRQARARARLCRISGNVVAGVLPPPLRISSGTMRPSGAPGWPAGRRTARAQSHERGPRRGMPGRSDGPSVSDTDSLRKSPAKWGVGASHAPVKAESWSFSGGAGGKHRLDQRAGVRRLSHKSSQHESQSAGMMVSTGPAARIPAEAPEHADAPSGTRGSKS
jgi:hypothetical protein